MDSVNKYGSDGVLFTGEIAEIKPSEEQIKQIVDAFVPTIQAVIDAIVPTINSCLDIFTQLWGEILKSYPDKRILHLAFHHPKERVRKKNRNRIIRELSKGER